MEFFSAWALTCEPLQKVSLLWGRYNMFNNFNFHRFLRAGDLSSHCGVVNHLVWNLKILYHLKWKINLQMIFLLTGINSDRHLTLLISLWIPLTSQSFVSSTNKIWLTVCLYASMKYQYPALRFYWSGWSFLFSCYLSNFRGGQEKCWQDWNIALQALVNEIWAWKSNGKWNRRQGKWILSSNYKRRYLPSIRIQLDFKVLDHIMFNFSSELKIWKRNPTRLLVGMV